MLHILSSLISFYTTSVLSSLTKVYTIYYSQQSDRGLHYLLFSAFWSVYTICNSSILIRVYTICLSQHYDQGLQYLPFSVWSRSTLSFSTVWSGSKLFTILRSLINVKIHCHSQEQCDQGLHCFPFPAVGSASTLFTIRSSLIRVYNISHSQSNQGLHY